MPKITFTDKTEGQGLSQYYVKCAEAAIITQEMEILKAGQERQEPTSTVSTTQPEQSNISNKTIDNKFTAWYKKLFKNHS